MKKLLLDTSIIIDFLRRKDKENALLFRLSDEDLYISIITHTELFAGRSVWEDEKVKKTLSEVFSGITIIPLSEDISQRAGYIKSQNSRISLIDSIVAASSMENNFPLVTFNIKDFEQIEKLKLFIDKQ
ncbi:type II toxin-antitoxin system VapC family toxin [Candidatus Gottesmanbacteria bacterium]|nr:type II toxin-antitoxin system VapC family toxin [Candidatus Gottesmanbacteria bacterium]